MWKKKGLNQIDWAISIGIFMLYISWFFILIKPFYVPITTSPAVSDLEEAFTSELNWNLNMYPLIVTSDIYRSNAPIAIDFPFNINKDNFIFSDYRYSDLNNDTLYFLADLSPGKNIFIITNSGEVYTPPGIQSDLFTLDFTSFSSTSAGSMTVNYDEDNMPYKYFHRDEEVIEKFKLMRNDKEVNVTGGSNYESKILSEHIANTSAGFDHISKVFAYNSRQYSQIVLSPFIERRTVTLSFRVHYPNYHGNNAHFGEIAHLSPDQCDSFDEPHVFFYDDEKIVGIIIDAAENQTEIKICYMDDTTADVNISMLVEGNASYMIHFDSLEQVPNGDFEDGLERWSFTQNTNPYRSCSSKEGTLMLLTEDNTRINQPYYAYIRTGDWSNESSSGFPVMGFGQNSSSIDGTGGAYDGRLLSDPFLIPSNADYLHIWRNYKIVGFDPHYNATLNMLLPDALYLDIRDALTDEVLMNIDTHERTDFTTNPTEREKVIDISSLRGKEVQISLNVIGHRNADPTDCNDGGLDESLAQIDDIYFSDENGTRVESSFDYDTIMSRIPKDVTGEFGLPYTLVGINLSRLQNFNDMSYYDLRDILDFPYDREFTITITNASNTLIKKTEPLSYEFGTRMTSPRTNVYSTKKTCNIMDRFGDMIPCEMRLKVW